MRRLLIDVAPLRSSPAFRRLWIGRGFSSFGSQMTLIAVIYQVWRLTHSTVWTGGVALAQATPLVVLGLFAGSLIDRRDRRRVYLVAAVGQAIGSVLLAGQALFFHVPPAAILGILAAQSCFSAVGAPAARTFVPRLLGPEQLAAGLALNRITFQSAMLAGPALGGLVIGWWSVGGCYAIDAATFAFGFYGAFGLPRMPADLTSVRPGVRGVLDGLRFIGGSRVVRGALLTDLAATVLSFPLTLFPAINAQRFHDNPRTLGLFLTAIGVGGLIASTLSGSFTRTRRPGVMVTAGSAGWGAAMIGFGLCTNAWVGLAFLVVAGVADTVSVVSRSTLIQLHTPDALLGRVAAAEQIVGQAGPDVGGMRAGLVAAATSASVALVSGGALCLAAVAWVARATPQLLRADVRGVTPRPVPAEG